MGKRPSAHFQTTSIIPQKFANKQRQQQNRKTTVRARKMDYGVDHLCELRCIIVRNVLFLRSATKPNCASRTTNKTTNGMQAGNERRGRIMRHHHERGQQAKKVSNKRETTMHTQTNANCSEKGSTRKLQTRRRRCGAAQWPASRIFSSG